MKMLTAVPIIAVALGTTTNVVATAPPAHFAPFDFLVGHCWRGTFPDGTATDTHCYEWVFGNKHIRDVHVVRNGAAAYRGETIYSWNAEDGRVIYRYWNSDGGFSDGDMVAGDDGTLTSAIERYVGENGEIREYRTVIEPLEPGQYATRTYERIDGDWREAWTMLFEQTSAVTDAEQ